MISFAQVLDEYYASLPSEELHRYLEIIARKGHKAIAVIDGLLQDQMGPPPDREEGIKIGPLDMSSIVAAALEIVTYEIEERKGQVILPESWPPALGHAAWVEEVWFNYLSNAVQYGGWPPRIELGATERVDGSIRFWVRDNGDGLTPEEQEGLFTPVVRLKDDPGKGYGLGLMVVRRIVERLGGQVGVESAGLSGQGSLFFFTLPAAE